MISLETALGITAPLDEKSPVLLYVEGTTRQTITANFAQNIQEAMLVF